MWLEGNAMCASVCLCVAADEAKAGAKPSPVKSEQRDQRQGSQQFDGEIVQPQPYPVKGAAPKKAERGGTAEVEAAEG